MVQVNRINLKGNTPQFSLQPVFSIQNGSGKPTKAEYEQFIRDFFAKQAEKQHENSNHDPINRFWGWIFDSNGSNAKEFLQKQKNYYAKENFEIDFNLDYRLQLLLEALAKKFGGQAGDYEPPYTVAKIVARPDEYAYKSIQLDKYTQWLADGKKQN